MTAQPKSTDHLPEYLSIAEAAARYHVSQDYIRHRIVDGSTGRPGGQENHPHPGR